MRERQRLTVSGVVQGVGFRPFVYTLALRHGLAGFVGNNSSGVFVELEGEPEALAAFRTALTAEAPPLAHIESVTAVSLPPCGDTGFTIVHSKAQAAASTLISPDICICDDCLRELRDPQDRRYRYPFINCTNCGPRFTIIRDIPYDRPLTTMAPFPMCPDCLAEYEDPLNRRFHAQPNACPVCGPHVWLEHSGAATGEAAPAETQAAISAAQALLQADKIVAVKGLGGFHLACDATSDTAVALLRERKGRVDKPFALMALDVASVRTFAFVSPEEEKLLTSKERPILLLRKKPDAPVSDLVAPGNDTVGVMLPYTPLHYLLLTTAERPSPIFVMTSGNYANEPIVNDNDTAHAQLEPLADAFLLHNRDIYARCDDSVVRLHRGAELPVRRSRGYAPFPVRLPRAQPPTLAVGGELKATFCLTKGEHAFMSQHIGDMENLETVQAFAQAVEHFTALFRVTPEILVSDMHPRYLSSRWAAEHGNGMRHVQVQHHHAHIAAVMAEHRLDGRSPVLGFSFDGTGYGTDGAIWGGEVLLADYASFERLAHLRYVPLVGGDAAVKRPYRTALAHLWAAGIPWDEDLPPVAAADAVELNVIRRQLEREINTVPTSSVGRLFDAVAALAGVRQQVTYEAQAAIELEAQAASDEKNGYTYAIDDGQFDAAPVLRAIVADLRAGVPAPIIAARFHTGTAELITTLSERLCQAHGITQVALSGGVFQNVTLLALTTQRLEAQGLTVLTHRLVPPNDGGLALGQAVIGAQRAV